LEGVRFSRRHRYGLLVGALLTLITGYIIGLPALMMLAGVPAALFLIYYAYRLVEFLGSV
jgi:hypothetical protein